MAKLLLIKLGGSLITNKGKDFTAKRKVILRLAKEIKAVQKSFSGKIIIAHGSGSFAHPVAAKYKTKEGIINKQSLVGVSLVANVAIRINRIVMKYFLKTKLLAVSFSPASTFFAGGRRLKQSNASAIFHSLKVGMCPVLYGDIVFDEEQGVCIFSAETVLSNLAIEAKNLFDEIKIIYCGNTDGVYDAMGVTVAKITPKKFKKLKKYILGSDKVDVTGGMLHKVEASLELAKRGIHTRIINGTRPGELKKAILGKKTHGTLISAS